MTISVKASVSFISITHETGSLDLEAEEAFLLSDALRKAVPDHAKLRIAAVDDRLCGLREKLAGAEAERSMLVALLKGATLQPATSSEAISAAPAAAAATAELVVSERAPEPVSEATVAIPEIDPEPIKVAMVPVEEPVLTGPKARLVERYLTMGMSLSEIAEMVGVQAAVVRALSNARKGKRAA